MEQPPPYNKVNPRQQTSNVAAIYDSPLDVQEHEYTYLDHDAKRMDSIEMRSLGEPSVNDGENRKSSTKCSKRVCCIVTVAIFILVILAAGGYGVFFILNQEKGASIVCPYAGENDTASISFSRPTISDFDDEVSITYTLQTGDILAIFPFSKSIHTLHNMEEGVNVITATGSDGSKTASCDFAYVRIPVNENSVVCSPACVNGGECTSPDTCDCATGYAGDICQMGVCTPTCMNGGTCVGPNTCQCVFGFIGLQCEKVLPGDCTEVKEQGNSESGQYIISPQDDGPSFRVYCDMETDDGDWTVFQRREDGSTNFLLNWADYEDGFGNTNSEHWLGNHYIHRITEQGQYELRIDMADFEGNTAYAKYSNFRMGNAGTNYKLILGTYSGDAGDSLANGRNQAFSTKDRDQDASNSNCAQLYNGGWWYEDCHLANLNGLYLGGIHESYADGIEWSTWKGYHYSLKKVEMKIRKA